MKPSDGDTYKADARFKCDFIFGQIVLQVTIVLPLCNNPEFVSSYVDMEADEG